MLAVAALVRQRPQLGRLAVDIVFEAGIEIDYTRFVELLNSAEQTDRNKGLFLLRLNGAEPDPRVVAALKERALPSLIEMCRWWNDGHAAPA